jgi:LETM1 and EF-hand domain-containing protein 1
LELLKFYFRGLKAINTHRKQVAAIRSRIATGGAALSRAESRFIRTFQQDALKYSSVHLS